jgi:DNA repair exonuclease SbcCD ATPase subunit
MRNLLKDRNGILREELQEVEYDVKLLNEKIILHEKQLEELKEKSDQKRKTDLEKIEETEREILKLHAEIEVHEEVIFSLTKSVSDESDVHKKNTDLDKYRSQINKNLKKLNKEKQFFEKNKICPTCEQNIDEDFKKHKCDDISDDISEMDDGLEKLEVEFERVLGRLEEISQCNKEVQYINSEITTKNGHIKSHNSFIQHLNEELSNKVEYIDDGKINILSSELVDQKDLRAQYSEQKKYYDILGTILNDKGIKTRIIRKYLPVINNYVNLYLKDMDFFVNFQLDENFQETIKSRHRDDFSYYSFSEGEKKRIDIALLLTWRHIAAMRNSVNVNLLILDEVFDASLDQAGVDDLMKLFEVLDNTNLFIISHKIDVLDDKFPSKITVEKLKNFTTMEYR